MFWGEFGYRIDEKGRVPIPPRFREALKREGLVLTAGVEKCITIYPLSEFQKVAASLTSGPFAQSKLRTLSRALFANAFNTEIDGQGRIAIPPSLKKHAEIKEEVVIVGLNNYLELWSQEEWEPEKKRSQEEAYQIIESLEKR